MSGVHELGHVERDGIEWLRLHLGGNGGHGLEVGEGFREVLRELRRVHGYSLHIVTDRETGVSPSAVDEALRSGIGQGGVHVEVCEGLLGVHLHPVDEPAV